MKTTPTLTATANSTVLAKLGTSYGYRFDADHVALTASFRVLAPLAHQRSWTLQLWACDTAPLFPAKLEGQLIASAVLPPLAEIADPVETFTANAAAILPAGAKDHVLVLALVSGKSDGKTPGEIHDVAILPQRESFSLPRLVNARISAFENGHVTVAATAVENPRATTNRSGTLSLELWALPTLYRGGAFTGFPVAGTVLGTLDGQCRLADLTHPLPATLPQETAQLCLMLREWTPVGYVTRDYVNVGEHVFAAPAVTAAAEPTLPVAAEQSGKPAPARKRTRLAKVAINTATEDELAAVKGISRAAAKSIVANRPYAKLNDLVKAKGIGPKLLPKIQSRLRLN